MARPVRLFSPLGIRSHALGRAGALGALAMALAHGAALAAVTQDLRDTPHNLARGATPGKVEPSELCVFCHTPTANPFGEVVRPQWQRALPRDFSYTMFDDIGRVGYAGSAAVGSQSIACLSCHDANQAFSVTRSGYDHPFGVPYRGALPMAEREQALEQAKASGAPVNAARQLKYDQDFRPAHRGLVDNRPVWWASLSGSSERRSRLDLPLFPRGGEGADADVPFIECASCHDPHAPTESFLRVEPAAGRICLTCHIK